MDLKAIIDFIGTINWAIFSNIAIIFTALFVIWKLRVMKHTAQAQAYSVARDILQDENVRKARKTVLKFIEAKKPIDKWSEAEKKDAEIVCHTYDSVGQMVRNRLRSKNMIIDNWGNSLRRSWPILEPLIFKYREKWEAPEIWDDYEWLSLEAKKRYEKQIKKQWWLRKARLMMISLYRLFK